MKTMSRRELLGYGAAGAAMAFGAGRAAASGWQPIKPVEMVIMAGQGGGADRLARLFQSIIQKENLSNMPFLPVNKGGGSGAEALRYLIDKTGDDHVVMATLNSYFTTPLRNPDLGVDIATFTPLARMAIDNFVLWVNADSGITTLEQFVEAVKAQGGAFKMGGTGTGQEDQLVTGMLEQAFGIKFTYVPFDGGGEVAKNLAGGHVNATVNNPSEAMGFFKAGKVTPLGAFSENRLTGDLASVATMREQGHDLVYTMQRSFVAPPGMSAEAAAYYTDLFTRLGQTPEWQDYASSESLDASMLTGADLQAYLLAERDKHATLLQAVEGA